MFSWDLLMQFQVYIQFLSMIDRKKPQPMFLKMKDEMVTVPKWCIVSKFRSRYVVFQEPHFGPSEVFPGKKEHQSNNEGFRVDYWGRGEGGGGLSVDTLKYQI